MIFFSTIIYFWKGCPTKLKKKKKSSIIIIIIIIIIIGFLSLFFETARQVDKYKI